jgi:acyl-CoA synthetase (AMP-forming)/AMP-acid ligase II
LTDKGHHIMPTDFAACLRTVLARHGEDRACFFVKDDLDGERVSYGQLDREARRVAAWLDGRTTKPVVLLYRDARHFLPAYLGCLYAGVVAVPVPLPLDKLSTDRVSGIMADAGAELVLTKDTLLDTDPDSWSAKDIDPAAIAMLQYTSGSTSSPRGVMVTHENLLANQILLQEQVGSDDTSVTVTWLPHFHDMGLIGTLLHTLYVGGDCYVMQPSTFLKRPIRWLEAITKWRATMTAAPDFAYDLCTKTITSTQLATLDLASLRTAVTGAEPIRAATIERFTRKFAPAGFRPEMFVPAYGLAEATLVVSAGTMSTVYSADAKALEHGVVQPGHGAELVRCGKPAENVRIVDPDRRGVLEPGQVGEIWLAGPSVAAGYYNRPDRTSVVFRAYTSCGQGPYLRTGDLGAVVDGELVVTGRLKDVLIVRGRNLYTQDVEHVVRDIHPALGAGSGVVFAVPGTSHEHVVVVHEVRTAMLAGLTLDELAARIKVTIARSFDMPAPSVVLTGRGSIRRTTSGKVRRPLMRTLFLANEIEPLHEDLQPALRDLRSR